MAAGKYSFSVEQGSTVKFDVAYKDSSNLGPCGSGLNFSGSSGLLPPTSGTIGVIISSATSSLLNFDQAVYDLEIASGSGDCAVVTRLIEGNIKLIKEVTTGSYV